MDKFAFEMGQKVRILASDEEGEIRSRCENKGAINNYRIHYKAADGRAVTDWFEEDLITPA